jgi:hypothetical protein
MTARSNNNEMEKRKQENYCFHINFTRFGRQFELAPVHPYLKPESRSSYICDTDLIDLKFV